MGNSDNNDKEWFERTERFINPYNFVGLGKETERKVPEYGNLTGKISCTLIVKTPLAIPDSETLIKDYREHSTYKFFRVDGKPVITGSQLKGMVRSYYEALSDSCLSVNNNNIMSARHPTARKAGLIQYKKDGWHLYPAKMKKNKNYRILKNDEFARVWYDSKGKEIKSYIFSLDGEEIKCDNLDEAVEDYYKNIAVYNKNGGFFKRYKGSLTYRLRKDASSNEMSPVFYEIVSDNDGNNIVYLSPSQMGRSVFRKRIDDILETHKSCSKTDGSCLCKACTLFGIVSDKSNSWASASRLRFSDAKSVEETFASDKDITLKELSSPKTTSVEFYTKRPEDAVSWTYESKTTGYTTVTYIEYQDDKEIEKTEELPDRLLCDVELNGRKFYLHNPRLREEDYSEYQKTKRNSSMELCRSGAEFEFCIYFENINEHQLNELIWTLALGENSADSDRMFKLGHGKPLGLGSVKVIVNSVDIRKFDTETFTYTIENNSPSEYLIKNPFDTSAGYYREFMKIVNFRTAESSLNNGAVISYPIAEDKTQKGTNATAHHQWFIANRSSGENGITTNWSIKYTLPRITDDDLSLPAYERRNVKKKSANGQGNKSKGKSSNNHGKRDQREQQIYSFGSGTLGRLNVTDFLKQNEKK